MKSFAEYVQANDPFRVTGTLTTYFEGDLGDEWREQQEALNDLYATYAEIALSAPKPATAIARFLK